MKERKRENSLQHSSWKYGYFAILAAYFQTTHTHTHTQPRVRTFNLQHPEPRKERKEAGGGKDWGGGI